VSLAARHIEAAGIPTVIVGSALDVVEHCGVPRFLFTDFPLGNPAGVPWDRPMQRAVVGLALGLLEGAVAPRMSVRAPFTWPGDPQWRTRYGRVDPADAARLRALGDARRTRQAAAKAQKP
jgi:hypothetical protein